MATGAAGDGMFQRLYDGCISTDEMVVRRRPYNSNCNCALHKYSGGGHCSPVEKVPYSMRRSWSEGRCRRTDGNKWRCRWPVLIPHQKYCECHIHRGRLRSRKPMEVHKTVSTSNKTISSLKPASNLQSVAINDARNHSKVHINKQSSYQ
ncbi:hypothetical protein L6452_05246 [Arctium lappa]|uniref:Uncharacterized protein n=1 Tax=Arctium lappa TaxID=4217 RepID=A0ACB9EFA4_ARCLA|nr:hypothetical protein L6452_05246 [Arctium lappa]